MPVKEVSIQYYYNILVCIGKTKMKILYYIFFLPAWVLGILMAAILDHHLEQGLPLLNM